ncbi:unnamed protein product [Musa acuminata subsp. burmannicoides]
MILCNTTVRARLMSLLHLSVCSPKSSTLFVNTSNFFLISSIPIFTASTSLMAKSALSNSETISISNLSIDTRMLSKSLMTMKVPTCMEPTTSFCPCTAFP